MLHLVPRWQSSDRHVKLKTIMQDRPDLIESELSGLAFDSNQQIFKSSHVEIMFTQKPPEPILNEAVYTFIDPAAGGPQSDYCVLSVTRHKGLLTVRLVMTSYTGRPASACPRTRCWARRSPLSIRGRARRTGRRRSARP